MSTFDGVVSEFPAIRIDYFRTVPGASPPLAYFLSHIHSDHCKGLENYKSPAFIYCSSATRELLLRLEKYSNRQIFDHGIFEAKRLHYKHLAKVLRPLPLNTPTNIELSSNTALRVTLLDANHCPGAVMFLIEAGSKAILYTGDVRAEDWWRQALLRSPVMIPYSGLRRLTKIYLDTTNASKSKKNEKYPSKATGMYRLLVQVAKYPPDTVFHINCWTLGYEEALASLASAFSTKIHIDRYKADLYRGLLTCAGDVPHSEVPFLSGFDVGSRHQNGVLTTDENTRFHTCNPYCESLRGKPFVRIVPIVAQGIYEVGAPLSLIKRKLGDRTKEYMEAIVYPFARHSSYSELRSLVAELNPEDIHPCVVPEGHAPDFTMERLFGDICTAESFAFDKHRSQSRVANQDSQTIYDTEVENESQAATDQQSTQFSSVATLSQVKSNPLPEDDEKTLDIVESQLTLQDSDFGSQTSCILGDTGVDQYEHRKRAYKAVRSGNTEEWEALSMLSTLARFEKETELG